MAMVMTMTQQPQAPPISPNVPINGSAIRARRIELGQNLVTFAPRVPLSFQYLSQLERGYRTHVSPETFLNLLRALDMVDRADELKAA
jgi:transcriptional regulator with XRE-family HTH domain